MYIVQSNVPIGILLSLAFLHTCSIVNEHRISEGFAAGLFETFDDLKGIDPDDDQEVREDDPVPNIHSSEEETEETETEETADV